MTAFTDLLADFLSEKVLVCHLEPFDPDAEDIVGLYFSTHGFKSEPADSPPNQYYDARLQRGYEYSRSLFSGGQLSGRSAPGAGSVTLNNTDGGLDALAGY